MGADEVICDAAVRMVSKYCPLFKVATGAPLTETFVPLFDARRRNVSPFVLVLSGTVTKFFPQAVVGGNCSTR
jgi:hypothetical protein